MRKAIFKISCDIVIVREKAMKRDREERERQREKETDEKSNFKKDRLNNKFTKS